MDGQGLQAIRGEVEAIVTFQSALNRLALVIDEDAVTEWTGPRPDDVDDLAGDDGTFSREELNDVRKQAGEALAKRFREVLTATAARPELQPILARALAAATGGVVALDGPEPGGVLVALSRTGSIRLDWAQTAAALVREALAGLSATPAARKPAAPKKKPAAAKKKAAPRATPGKTAKAAKKTTPKAPAKKPAPKKPAPKKSAPRKPVATKPAAKKPAPRKKR